MRTKEELLNECPVSMTLQVIDSKWKVFIINILNNHPMRFSEIEKTIKGLSKKVLTDSLRSLEADGIVARTVYAETPVRVEYSLTELGNSMRPILDAMDSWGTNFKMLKAAEME